MWDFAPFRIGKAGMKFLLESGTLVFHDSASDMKIKPILDLFRLFCARQISADVTLRLATLAEARFFLQEDLL